MKTYGDVFEEYEWHPESKNADANGDPAGKQTVGLLQRRHVHVAQVIYIGRESNQLEAVEAGMTHDAAGMYTEYVDPQREAWFRAAQVVALKEWERETGKPRRLLIDARLGRRRPHRSIASQLWLSRDGWAGCESRKPARCVESERLPHPYSDDQFAVGRSRLSMTSTSIAARVDSSLRPSCSCSAVVSDGPVKAAGGSSDGASR